MNNELDNVEMFELTEEDLRETVKRKLIEVNKEKRVLDRKAVELMISLSDPEKMKKVTSIVDKLHGVILDTESSDKDKILKEALTEDEYDFYVKHKHESFFKGVDLFEKYIAHPVQVGMVKEKCLNKRKIKKQKTANQHVECIISSKDLYELKKEQEVLKRRQDAMEERLQMLEEGLLAVQKQHRVQRYHAKVEVPREKTDALHRLVLEGFSDKAVAAYTESIEYPSITQEEIASYYKVSRRTIIRWFKEVEEALKGAQ